MRNCSTGCIIIKNNTVEVVQNVICRFLKDNRNYNSRRHKNRWRCQLVRSDNHAMVLQLEDVDFEQIRGYPYCDAPYLTLNFAQSNENVEVYYRVKMHWSHQITYSISLFLFLCFTIFSYSIITDSFGVIMAILGTLPPFGIIFVVCREIMHYKKIISLFEEILQRKFSIDT